MKKLLIFALMVVFMLALTTSTFATTIERSSTYFNSDWETVVNGTDYVMVYGYNTSWINEDYCHTKHNKVRHTAMVVNGSDSYTDTQNAAVWAYVDVIHNGSPVFYYLTF